MLTTTIVDEPSRAAIQVLQDQGYQALYCGGCVRDLLLGKIPKDYDVVTSATPEQVASTGMRVVIDDSQLYGVTFVVVDGVKVDIATMRQDIVCDGRRATVTYTDQISLDAMRRDFTVNALYWDPISGEVLDPTGKGLSDMRSRLLRAVGDPVQRYREDYLRILRLYRLSLQLGFTIDQETGDLARAMSPDIVGLSAERITDEVLRSLRYPDALLRLESIWRALELAPANLVTANAQHNRLLELQAMPELSLALLQGIAGLRLSRTQESKISGALSLYRGLAAYVDSIEELIRAPHSLEAVLLWTAVNQCDTMLTAYWGNYAKATEPPLVGGDDLVSLGIPATAIRRDALLHARRLQDGGIDRDSILRLLGEQYG